MHQQFIAGTMAVGIVDPLEAVDVDEQHGGAVLPIGRLMQPAGQTLQHQHPVGQAGEGVMGGFMGRLQPGLPLRGDGLQQPQAEFNAAGHGPQERALLQVEGIAEPAHHQLVGPTEGGPAGVQASGLDGQLSRPGGRLLQEKLLLRRAEPDRPGDALLAENGRHLRFHRLRHPVHHIAQVLRIVGGEGRQDLGEQMEGPGRFHQAMARVTRVWL